MNKSAPGPRPPWFKPLRLISANPTPDVYPLSIGMCLAYVRRHLSRDLVEAAPRFVHTDEELHHAVSPEARNILLCSNHLWSLEYNLRLSGIIKRAAPDSLTIHGGPSTPSYPRACEELLRHHPEVDYAVCGEGERVLAELLTELLRDKSEPMQVAGVALIHDDEFILTPNRPPMPDLDRLPSPFLDGLFDRIDPATCPRSPSKPTAAVPTAVPIAVGTIP